MPDPKRLTVSVSDIEETAEFILDLSIDSLIKHAQSDVSVVSISNFERGHIHSTKMITIYFNASKSVQSDQSETLNTFLKMAIDEYFVSLQKINTLR